MSVNIYITPGSKHPADHTKQLSNQTFKQSVNVCYACEYPTTFTCDPQRFTNHQRADKDHSEVQRNIL